MLKDRLHKWDRGKNIKSREIKAILRKLPARELAHKHSEFRVRGMTVPIAKVKRYQRMDGSKLCYEIDRIKSPTPPALEIRTPPASPLSTPRSLKIPEDLMKCIRNYVFEAFAENIWVSVGDLEDVRVMGANTGDMADFIDNINLTHDLLNSSHFSDAELSLNRAERALSGTIRSQHARLIPNLLATIQRYLCSKKGNGNRDP